MANNTSFRVFSSHISPILSTYTYQNIQIVQLLASEPILSAMRKRRNSEYQNMAERFPDAQNNTAAVLPAGKTRSSTLMFE